MQAAARLVGVGRPAFSNFVNGRAGTSSAMAARIERAFGVPAQDLLDMQAAYDSSHISASDLPATVAPYVAPFLEIAARDIEAWVDRDLSARARLSVLLRILVHSTGLGLTRVDFPGNDDSQRPGWDGYVEGTDPTPWLPQGASGWEFGVNKNVKRKADSDFAKAHKAVGEAERKATSFIFVTPRHWPGKSDWVLEKASQNLWKEVRAYDSSDLEQWLQQSIPGQTWFANETVRPSEGVWSLDKCWSDWADVTDPPLIGSLFAPAIEVARGQIATRLAEPPSEPIVISADSVGEALAFLAQLFGPGGGEELERCRDRVLIFDRPGTLPRLAQGTKNFIAVATNREVEMELGPLAGTMHSIVIYPRNVAHSNPHITLEPLAHDALRASLEEMHYQRDDVERYAIESGRSLTILRRRLSTVPAVRTPRWAAQSGTAADLVPLLLVGTWSATNTADQTVLKLLAEADSFDELERRCQRLAALNDPPIWSIGSYRGVLSKIDILFAVADHITSDDLGRYFELAKIVLGEDDPKLDLPADQRWAAVIHHKSREFSEALRDGVRETLVLLAVHGNYLFRERLGVDCEVAVVRLVHDLLTPLKTRLLEANDRDLPSYAEAAPDEFLSILEEDLEAAEPATYGLLEPVGSAILGGCPRSGLLWALEGLAWNPETLPRVALILARLSHIEINDNWVNKPINSLVSIFRVWMPQTAAGHDVRLETLKLLVRLTPQVGWKVCLAQVAAGDSIGHYNYKPRWRNDGHGFGEPIRKLGPIRAFVRDAAEIVLNWESYTHDMLCDLVQQISDFDDSEQAKVWELIRAWGGEASDPDRAVVREQIRVAGMSRQGVRRATERAHKSLRATADAVYRTLEPEDIVVRHGWLFREHWIEESASELVDEEFEPTKREARITRLRTSALREIYEARGLEGVIDLAENGNTARVIGWLMADEILSGDGVLDLLSSAIPLVPGSRGTNLGIFLGGVLASVEAGGQYSAILDHLKERLSKADLVSLMLLAPFSRTTWRFVDALGDEHSLRYWQEAPGGLVHGTQGECTEVVQRLLSAKRPRAAFACARFGLDALSPELLFRVMSEIPKSVSREGDGYQLDRFELERAFELLNNSPKVTIDQMAGLEFAYIDALYQPWREDNSGIPNLEKYINEHPELFVQAVVWTYRRDDKGEDPAEWKVPSAHAQSLAERGHKLLDSLGRTPGMDDRRVLRAERLASWVAYVRDSCSSLARGAVADHCIGKLLSAAPAGEDGIWPCEPVRQVMEELGSKGMMEGARIGRYNSRGVTWRGEGGDQERELANMYRQWANSVQYSHPFVASNLLMSIANTYDSEASNEDLKAGIRKRLPD